MNVFSLSHPNAIPMPPEYCFELNGSIDLDEDEFEEIDYIEDLEGYECDDSGTEDEEEEYMDEE